MPYEPYNINPYDWDRINQEYQAKARDYANIYSIPSNPNIPDPPPGKEPFHNDSVDAFRHAFIHAVESYYHSYKYSQIMGDYWEKLHPNTSSEKYMDLWNIRKRQF